MSTEEKLALVAVLLRQLAGEVLILSAREGEDTAAIQTVVEHICRALDGMAALEADEQARLSNELGQGAALPDVQPDEEL